MSYGNFDYAEGTDFEKKFIRYLWHKYPNKKKAFGKPDIYDFEERIFYECKMTRPYYDKNPSAYYDAKDIGTGLPINQYNRYVQALLNGSRVILIHGMSEGRYKGRIFQTELDAFMICNAVKSPQGNTVYWEYEKLDLLDVTIDNLHKNGER